MALAEAIERVKAELGLDASLRGKAAVDAARELVLSRGTLKEQVAALCRELGIEHGDGDGGGGGGGAADDVLRAENEALRAENAALREAARL